MGYLDELGERIAKAADDAGLTFEIVAEDGSFLYQMIDPVKGPWAKLLTPGEIADILEVERP